MTDVPAVTTPPPGRLLHPSATELDHDASPRSIAEPDPRHDRSPASPALSHTLPWVDPCDPRETVTIISAIVVALFVAFVATALALRPGSSWGGRCRRHPGKVVLVEFLDFDANPAGQRPVVEERRTTYAGKVDFVVLRRSPATPTRSTPPSLSRPQPTGQVRKMYKRMYDAQSEWGEQRNKAVRGFARAWVWT